MFVIGHFLHVVIISHVSLLVMLSVQLTTKLVENNETLTTRP